MSTRALTSSSGALPNSSIRVGVGFGATGADSLAVVVHPQSIIHSLVEYQDGSVIAQSNASTGAVGNKYKYGPFGESAATLTGTTIGYTGQRYDTELGLYHYKARYFHPGIGRFLQPDPVGYKAGMNLYAYCSNDGLNHTDPDGLEPKEPVDILVKTWKSGKTSLFINPNAFKDAIGAVGISTEYIGSTLKPGLQSAMAMSERHLHDIRKVAGTALNPNAIKEVVFPVKLGENVHQVEQAGKVAMEKAKLAITNMRNPGKSLEPLGKAIGRSFSIIEKANPVILQFDLIEPLLREQFGEKQA